MKYNSIIKNINKKIINNIDCTIEINPKAHKETYFTDTFIRFCRHRFNIPNNIEINIINNLPKNYTNKRLHARISQYADIIEIELNPIIEKCNIVVLKI